MIDFIAKLISGDGVTTILMILGIYIASIWFLFSFWVFIDAKKRYKNTIISILFFVVVLIFNFPALIFYLITRPENEDDFVVLPADNLHNIHSRGVNIPIVNFVGKDGKVNLSFELKINNPELVNLTSDMTVDVNWKSNSNDFVKVDVVESVSKESETEDKKRESKINKAKQNLHSNFIKAKNKVKNLKSKFVLPKKKA